MKTYKKGKPSYFKLWDAVTFGGPPIIVAGLTIYSMVHGAEGPKGWLALMWTVVAVMAFIYVRLVMARKKYLDRFTFIGGPKYGFLVDFGDYKPENPEKNIPDLTTHTIAGWSKLFPGAESIITKDYIWVWFQPGPITRIRGVEVKPVAGYTVVRGRDLVVGYREPNQLIGTTAFQHELGHLIQGVATGDWDEAKHHDRAKRNGLP